MKDESPLTIAESQIAERNHLVGVVAAGPGDGQVAAVHGEDALAAGGAVAAQPAVAALRVGHPAAAHHPRPEPAHQPRG